MAIARRRILRTRQPARNGRQLDRLRDRLNQQRAALARWVIRLKRAFHAFEKHQQVIARVERQISKLQEE